MAECRGRGKRGSVTVLIVGLAVVLLMMAAVVTDASAAYLQRQGLDTLADGAALTGADAGASGDEAYADGLDSDLHLDADIARAAVLSYLHRVGAYERYPGLTAQVSVDSSSSAGDRRGAARRSVCRSTCPDHPGRRASARTSAATVGVDG